MQPPIVSIFLFMANRSIRVYSLITSQILFGIKMSWRKLFSINCVAGFGLHAEEQCAQEGLWTYECCQVWWSCQEFQRWSCSSVIFMQLLWPCLGLQAIDFVAQNLWISNSNIWSGSVFMAPLTLKSLGVSVPGFLQLAAFLLLNLHNFLCLVL